MNYKTLLDSLPHDFSLALQRNLDETDFSDFDDQVTYFEIVAQLKNVCDKTLKSNPFQDSEKQKLVEVVLHFIAIAAAQLIAPKL